MRDARSEVLVWSEAHLAGNSICCVYVPWVQLCFMSNSNIAHYRGAFADTGTLSVADVIAQGWKGSVLLELELYCSGSLGVSHRPRETLAAQ